MEPLQMKMTAERRLKLAAARQLSIDHPGRTARVYSVEPGRTVVRFDRDDAHVDGWIAAYRCGRLILPNGGLLPPGPVRTWGPSPPGAVPADRRAIGDATDEYEAYLDGLTEDDR